MDSADQIVSTTAQSVKMDTHLTIPIPTPPIRIRVNHVIREIQWSPTSISDDRKFVSRRRRRRRQLLLLLLVHQVRLEMILIQLPLTLRSVVFVLGGIINVKKMVIVNDVSTAILPKELEHQVQAICGFLRTSRAKNRYFVCAYLNAKKWRRRLD